MYLAGSKSLLPQIGCAVVNLEFMKESLNETLIPCLVIKTSWHKLSTVLGHGESSFYLQGSKKRYD